MKNGKKHNFFSFLSLWLLVAYTKYIESEIQMFMLAVLPSLFCLNSQSAILSFTFILDSAFNHVCLQCLLVINLSLPWLMKSISLQCLTSPHRKKHILPHLKTASLPFEISNPLTLYRSFKLSTEVKYLSEK